MVAEPLAHVGVRRFVEEKDKQSDLLEAYENMSKARTAAGVRAPTTDKSAYSLSKGVLLRRKHHGLGLPGAGWFERERAKLREHERRHSS